MKNTKRDELRWMLKRIAMGLAVSPLALIAGCFSCAPCAQVINRVQGVSQEALESIQDGECRSLCSTTDFASSDVTRCRVIARDASSDGVDARSASDAGPTAGWIECTYHPGRDGLCS